jgi:hypothetical protein
MSAMSVCPKCHNEVPDYAPRCPYCDTSLTPGGDEPEVGHVRMRPRRRVSQAAIFVIAVALIATGLARYILHQHAMRGDDMRVANALHFSNSKFFRVKVPASSRWVSLDTAVSTGDMVYLAAARGTWRIDPNCKMVGFEGHEVGACSMSPKTKAAGYHGRIIASANQGALLWRVDSMQNAAFSVIPGLDPQELESSGKLQFQINDDVLEDNDGMIEVEIVVSFE